MSRTVYRPCQMGKNSKRKPQKMGVNKIYSISIPIHTNRPYNKLSPTIIRYSNYNKRKYAQIQKKHTQVDIADYKQ